MIDSRPLLVPRKPAFTTTMLRTVAVDSKETIGMDSEHEVRAWCDELGCSYQQLRAAVKAVGPSVDSVCAFLAEH